MEEQKMTGKKDKFSKKYGPEAKPDPKIQEQVLRLTKTDELACAVAFKITEKLGVEPSEVGKTADLMEYRLVKCQLGLSGYKPERSIVKPVEPEDKKITEAIERGLVDSCLPCKTAWEIASEFSARKMAVSSACEALGVKIKPCQLGAF
jgi:hypothetical protein